MHIASRIDTYLHELAAALGALPADERENILVEIRSHLEEAGRDATSLDLAIADLGSPQALARSYGGEPRRALPLLAYGRRGIAVVPAVGAAAALYLVACGFTAIALIRPFAPEGLPGFIGKFGLGPLARTPEATEILGWSLLPIGLFLAAAAAMAATMIVRRGTRGLLRPA